MPARGILAPAFNSAYDYFMNRKAIAVVAVVTGVLVIGGLVIALSPDKNAKANKNTKAQSIPYGAKFEEVKRLSQGDKPRCLSDNATANQAVKKIVTKDPVNSFDLVLGMQIIDMPAGYTTDTIYSFDSRQATGTISYTDANQKKFVGNLKSFNYTADVDSSNNWKVTNFIACAE